MRNLLNMPVEYESRRGYILKDHGESFELPGLWFNESELYALLTTHHLLKGIQPGLLEEQIQPLRNRLDKLLKQKELGSGEIDERVRIIPMAARPVDLDKFRAVATALVKHRQIHMFYHGRARDENTERNVSPQRLIYYRGNWYLDAWCHLRESIRSFSIDRVEPRSILKKKAKEIDEEVLEKYLAESYGIFAGRATKMALLRFTGHAAKWVGDEQWHPKQQVTFHKDGSLELTIPYNHPEELTMDILKYGPDVEVIKPLTLRKAIAKRLRNAASQYKK